MAHVASSHTEAELLTSERRIHFISNENPQYFIPQLGKAHLSVMLQPS